MGSRDGMVSQRDLLKAGTEIGRSLSETASMMNEIEPAIGAYVDTTANKVAEHLATSGAKIEDAKYVAVEIRRLGYAVARSMQIGWYRLWADYFLAESQMADLDKFPKDDEESA
jgi:hypothetical protein